MTRRLPIAIEPFAKFATALLIGADVLVGLVLRFKTTSKLWLDEAQGVNIASHPLSQLTGYLRHDGAPPLYYIVLHFWIKVVGSSDFDVRALSGVFAVLALAATYFALKAWWGREHALYGLAVLAVLPYAIYFGTETRMYSLVMFLSAVIMWALRSHLDRPRWQSTLLLSVLGGLLLYTHYWAIYLLGVIGLYSLIRWWRHRVETARRDWLLVIAISASFVSWVPWLPIFNVQRLHTGTPWAKAPTLYQLFTWFSGFAVNQSVPHIVASLHTQITLLVFVAFLIFGVFGQKMIRESRLVTLDPTGVADSRTIAFIVIATMAAGLVASHIDGSAYVPRYAAVIVIPLCFLVARGIKNFETPVRILIAMGLLSGAFLWTDKWGIGSQRTEAGVISAALATVPTNSVVFVCPDQLGPSLLRYANPNLTYKGYPRFETPTIVNWYDYRAQYKRVTPTQNALQQAQLIRANQAVYIVRAHNYGLKETCWYFENALARDLHRTVVPIVKERIGAYYQPMSLQELPPVIP